MSYYTNVIFDEVDITEIPGVYVSRVIVDGIPEPVISSGKLARQDGIKVFNKEYGAKPILVEGHIAQTTRDDYLATRSILLKKLGETVKTLQVPISPMPLEYECTVSNVLFSDIGGGYAKFSISFLCTDPYGYDRDNRVLLSSAANTTSPYTFTLLETIGGTMHTPGLFTVNILSLTGGTSKYIELKSEAGESIKVTRTWTAGDVLEVDMKAKTVKVNGLLTDYTGSFWDFQIDETYFYYLDSLTTRSMTMSASYKRRTV